jgi:Protein of unknown function (DUF1153)
LNSIIEQSAEQSPSMDDLPPLNTTRWTIRRKAAVVVAVRSGTITMEEALRRYQLTEEEFLSWQRAFRDPRPRRFAYHACSAIPRVEAIAPPQIATLIPLVFSSGALHY